jgi:hypothetical protein
MLPDKTTDQAKALLKALGAEKTSKLIEELGKLMKPEGESAADQ